MSTQTTVTPRIEQIFFEERDLIYAQFKTEKKRRGETMVGDTGLKEVNGKLSAADATLQRIMGVCPKLRKWIEDIFWFGNPSKFLLDPTPSDEGQALSIAPRDSSVNWRVCVSCKLIHEPSINIRLFIQDPGWRETRFNEFKYLDKNVLHTLDILADPETLTRSIARALFP